MKKIVKNTTKGAQSVQAFYTACGCPTCQECRTGSSQAIDLQNNVYVNNDQMFPTLSSLYS